MRIYKNLEIQDDCHLTFAAVWYQSKLSHPIAGFLSTNHLKLTICASFTFFFWIFQGYSRFHWDIN